MSVKISRYDLLRGGDVLSTRDRGRAMGRDAIDSLEGATALLLNFTGVEVVSPPYLDEFLAAVRGATVGGDSGLLVVLVGLNDDVRESLNMVLDRRKMVMAELTSKEVKLLGGAEQLRDTMRAALALPAPFTAPELAKRLKLKLPALHQRLRALTETGAVAREPDPSARRGKRHAYVTPSDAEIKRAARHAERLQPA